MEKAFIISDSEIEAIRKVVSLARVFGFGNLIAVLRKEWADKLLESNPRLNRKIANEATISSPYKKKFW